VAGITEGRVVVITGAGGGIGRGHALEFARQGARVVVNDRGVAVDGGSGGGGSGSGGSGSGGSGSGGSSRGGRGGLPPAEAVVAEIRDGGGQAVASEDDVASWEGAGQLVDRAVSAFGGLDVVVNNAGILRDRMIVNMTLDDWDAVVRVHLGGTFCLTHWAATWWRARAKAGAPVEARVINTSSGAGLYGNPGQANYTAAKAGIVGFTLTAAAELARYGVTVNALLPGGRTRMTESLFPDVMASGDEGFDRMDPANVAPLVVWLGSGQSSGITGRVFEAMGGRIAVEEGWRPGPRAELDRRWDPAELGPVIRRLLDQASPPSSMLDAAG
jgi:NAD(P)-dependent dehydrogenase (short-subunit alcohol dehydrogenase family)